MAKFDAKHIRNVIILGHQSSGKTTLVESLAFVSGLIPQKGEVERKNTLSDYSPDEQKRGASIQTAVVPLFYKDHNLFKTLTVDIFTFPSDHASHKAHRLRS